MDPPSASCPQQLLHGLLAPAPLHSARTACECVEAKAAADPEWQALLDRVVSREIDPATAARELLAKELPDE